MRTLWFWRSRQEHAGSPLRPCAQRRPDSALDKRKRQLSAARGVRAARQELQVAYKPLAQQLDVNSQQYRQELARVVYNALARNNQSTLLILDNAQDPSLVTDYLLHRPNAIQAIITTRSAEAFEGTYEPASARYF